jgi:hypothetical protein
VGEARAAARRTPRGTYDPRIPPSVGRLVRCSTNFASSHNNFRAERPEGEARNYNTDAYNVPFGGNIFQ